MSPLLAFRATRSASALPLSVSAPMTFERRSGGGRMQLIPYLYFKGDCEEALRFASSSGLGELVDLRRYEGTPLARRAGAAWNLEVLHFEFKGAGVRFYADHAERVAARRGPRVITGRRTSPCLG